MRKFTLAETYARLTNGIRFVIPVSRHPAENPPCRAIVEAAGIPGIQEGHGRLTRKRFIKLLMSTGNSRLDAEYLAFAAHANKVSYRDCLQRTVIPMVMKADGSMKAFFSGAVLAKAELIRDEVVQEDEVYVVPVSDESAGDAEV